MTTTYNVLEGLRQVDGTEVVIEDRGRPAPARVISAQSSALLTSSSRPLARSPLPMPRTNSRAAPKAANNEVAGV